VAKDLVGRVRVKTTGIGQAVSELSGGNQQKVVFGKCLAQKIKVLLLDEPTRGVDVGSKREIYEIVRGVAAEGTGVILVSSDLPEIVGIADRVVVLKDGAQWRGRFVRNYGTFGGLVAICVIFAILKPSVFLTGTNLRNILAQVAILGIVALMQTLVLVVGDFDMSLGAQVSLTSVVVAQLMVMYGLGTIWAVLIALVIGAAVGAINGLLVSYGNMSAFVTTLATMTSLEGAAWLIAGGTTVHGVNDSFRAIGASSVGPVPTAVIICLVILIIGYFVVERTTIGRGWY
jgi:energy-coupling factor transporter ATP-binding protein EcfA2